MALSDPEISALFDQFDTVSILYRVQHAEAMLSEQRSCAGQRGADVTLHPTLPTLPSTIGVPLLHYWGDTGAV